ncbi:MAG TPA: hypothetical protein VKK31_26090 [Thermoanaerobaculia bacterium]|nr:hypothetical protein [Thermoanaerobaculia bacterium]
MAEDHRRVRVLQILEPDSDPLPEQDGGSAAALLDYLGRARSTLDHERAEAPALAAELLALPQDIREERLRRDPRFHTWGLAELLLGRSAEAREDPAEAGRLAALALAGADALDRTRHAAPVVEDLKARAWAAAGEACLRRGDPAGAEEALRAAASCLSRGTGDLLVEARLLEFEAYVRRGQARPGEAAALLKMAAARYREIGDVPLLERTLAERDALLWQQPARPA